MGVAVWEVVDQKGVRVYTGTKEETPDTAKGKHLRLPRQSPTLPPDLKTSFERCDTLLQLNHLLLGRVGLRDEAFSLC